MLLLFQLLHLYLLEIIRAMQHLDVLIILQYFPCLTYYSARYIITSFTSQILKY